MKTKKIQWINILIFTFISMIFMGCGGGSSSSEKAYTVGKGTYIDSAVSGISYICGEETGVTDENGQFSFEVGASCTFFIKDIELRKVAKDSLHDKVIIFEDHPKVAQFLQTLDSDGDPSNGITIDPKVIELLDGTLPESEAELEALVERIREAAKKDKSIKYRGDVATEEEAQQHLEETRQELDNTPPTIILNGVTPMNINQNASFEDPGITATDDYYDADEIVITTTGTVDTTTPDSYTITYTATDGASNSATATRVVNVVDVTAPVITLNGDANVALTVGETYTEAGATVSDNVDTNLHVVIGGATVNTATAGTYVITYNVRDSAGNDAVQVTRTIEVTVVPDTEKPVITLTGNANIALTVGETYTEAGATVSDNVDTNLHVVIAGATVNTATAGTYVITYNVRDSAGNDAVQVTRTIEVTVVPDTTKPVITLVGNSEVNIIVGETYSDAGATASDDRDGDITSHIVVTSDVNSSLVGTYTVRYDVNDTADNVATTVIRTVHVNNLVTTLEDLNLTVAVKGQVSDQDNGNSDVIHPIVEEPEHGTAEHFLLGNEIASVSYTSTSCFTGLDTFIYRNGDEYGKVNVTITTPGLEDSPDYSETLLNNTTITGEELLYSTPQVEITTAPTHGTATLDNSNGEITYYNYDPDDTYSGDDFFIYTITETINGCTYTSTGRVDFTVESSNVKPTIRLLGNSIETILVNTTYTDAGATALDNEDGNITSNIIVTSDVNSSTVGTYTVSYNVTDSQGSAATTVTRTIHVVNNFVTTLNDLNLTVIVKGQVSDQDNGNSDVIHPIVEEPEHGTAEHFLLGNEIASVSYTSTSCFTGLDTFIYRNGDEYGKVNVTITTPGLEDSPDYSETLLNNTTITGEELLYSTPQVEITTAPTHGTATLDNSNGEITYYNYDPDDTYSGDDFFIYTITETINGCTYTSTGRVDFTVQSSDTEKPIITLVGNPIEEIMLDSTYNDAGATAFDNDDGDITSSIVVTNGVDSSTVGTYTVSYNVTDSQGNAATTVTRTVNVSSTANVKLISLCQDPYNIGAELYKTDGTLAGTSLVKDIMGGSAGSAIYIPLNSKIGDIQYFNARDYRHNEFWMSDGTDAGTIIHEINPNNAFTAENIYGNSNPGYHTTIGNKLFFTASDKNVSRYGLYKAEGTTVTRISDTSGYKYSEINASLYYMTERDNTLFIEKTNSDFSGVEVVDSFANYDSGDLYNLYGKLVAIDDTLFFVMRDKSNMGEGLQLWSKKGDAPAIRLSSSYKVDDYNQELVKIGNKIYVIVNELDIGDSRRLMESDGTVAGTKLIHTFPVDESIRNLITINNKLYFIHMSKDDNFNTYYKLHSYTPESETFALVKDIIMNDYGDSTVSTMHKMYTFENRILFETLNLNNANDHFEQLWVSDGTTEGTLPILRRDYQATSLREPFKLNGKYFFQDTMDVLYETDFTMAGTHIVIPYSCDITPNSFSFTDLYDVELNQMQEAEMTVEGISYPETQVSIENGEYSLDNRQTWINTPSTVVNGQQIYVRHMSSADYETTVDTVLHVGERSDTFSSTTKAEILTTPDVFTFTDRNAVALSTVQTDSITVTGINQEVNLSIEGGEYSLDNGTTWSDVNVTVENNQVVIVRHTSSSSYNTAVSTTLTIAGVSDTFTTTTRDEDVDSGETVVVGDLMWEDTPHVQSVEANWVNYTEAVAYCSTLDLNGFSDWRLPHATYDENFGYNRTNNEFLSIRQQPLDLNGEVWFYQYDNGDNYDQIDVNSRSIMEPFTYINQGGTGYWTDDQAGMTNGHMNVIFSGGLDNMDGWSDDWNSSVRCVRTLQTDNTPLVVEAGSDQSVEVNHAITITGSATSSATISSYEWKYGANVVGTTASFEYTPTTVNRQVLVLKVVDADGNSASDVMHLKVEEANPLPTVDAGENKTVQVGESIIIAGTANDDSAIVGYEWKEGETPLADTVSFTYTPSSAGTKTLTLTVTDDDGATASDTMEVEVTEAPDSVPNAFTFTDVTNAEPNEVQQANITVSGINTPATISIVNGEYTLDGGTTWTTANNTVANGVTVTVRHYSSNEYETDVNTTLTIGGVSDTFTSTTRAFVDQPPEVSIFGQTTTYNQTVYLGEGSPYVDAMISDDVGVTYCKWEDSDGTTITEATIDPAEQYPHGVCQLDLSPFTEVGEYIYTLSATDTENQTNNNELNITVLPNSTPTADIGGNRTISAGTTLNITATVNDADGDEMNYQWMYGVRDSGSMNGAGSTLEFAQPFNDEGDYVVTFRVADTHNASVTKEINVTVTAAVPDNTPPVITINGDNPIDVISGEGYYDEGATATDDIDGSVSVSVEDNVDEYKAGDYNVTYRAVDNAGNEAVAVRIVHVLPNLAIYMYDDTLVSLGQDDVRELHFGISSDVQDVVLLNNPDFVNLVDHGDTTYHLAIEPMNATVANYYTMTVVAYDASGDLNVTETIHVYYDTPAPRLDVVGESDVEVNVNETVNINYIAENLTNLVLVNIREGESLPSYITLDEANSKIVINPTEAMSKSEFYELKLIGSETTNNITITRELMIRVRPEGTNHTPVIHLDEDYYEIMTKNEVTPLSITINATDSDGDDMSYAVQYYRGGLEVYPDYVDLSGNIITITPNVDHIDELKLLIHVTDDNGASATKSIDVHIKDQLPTIEFNVEITDTEYDSQTAISSSPLIGTVMYKVEFDQCESSISLVELNSTAIAFKNPDTNEIEFSNTYTEQGDNSLLFENGMQVKYIGEVTDLTAMNTLAGIEVFTAGTTDIVAYESVYAGQDDEGNPEFERFMWFNEAGKTAFETFAENNACGGGKGK